MKTEDSEPSADMSSGRRVDMMVFSEELEPFFELGFVSSSSRSSCNEGLPVGCVARTRMNDVSIVAIVSDMILSTANWNEEGTVRLLKENSGTLVSRLLMAIFSFFLLCSRVLVDVCSGTRPDRMMRRTRRVWEANRSVKRNVICPSSSSSVDRNKLSIDTSFSPSSASFESAVSSSVTTGAD